MLRQYILKDGGYLNKENYIFRIAFIIMLAILVGAAGIYIYDDREITNDTSVNGIKQPEYMNNMFDDTKVLKVNINIDEEEFENLKHNATAEEYYKADIEINGETYHNVGIRPKGNSSLAMVAMDESTDRYSFKIKADQYEKNQRINGAAEFVLNNNIADATNMKEYLSYSMLRDMDIKTPGCAYAHINLNNKPWGIYLVVENIDENFLKRNFGSVNGDLYKVETTVDHENVGDESNAESLDSKQKTDFMEMIGLKICGGDLVYNGDNIENYADIFNGTVTQKTTEQDYTKVIESIKNLNEGNNLEQYINVDEVLRYFAVNTFLVNLDSYASNMKHNFYLYEENGRMEIIPWDYNLSFSGYYLKEPEKAVNFPIDAPVTDTMEKSPLISKLLEVPEYKEKYHEYLKDIVENYVQNGKFKSIVDNTDKLIGEEVKNDPTAFYPYDQYKEALYNLNEFAKDRGNSILEQLSGNQPSEKYGNLNTKVNLDIMGQEIPGLGTFMKPEIREKIKDIDEEKVMSVLYSGFRNGELTEEAHSKLQELGLDEEQIGIVKGSIRQNSSENWSGSGGSNSGLSSIKRNVIYFALYVAAMGAVLIFVQTFKRKRPLKV